MDVLVQGKSPPEQVKEHYGYLDMVTYRLDFILQPVYKVHPRIMQYKAIDR